MASTETFHRKSLIRLMVIQMTIIACVGQDKEAAMA